MLSRKALLQQKQEEFTDSIRKLGAIPSGGFDQSLANKSSKQLVAEVEECHRQLAKLGHVNKKALDQFSNFSDQRHKLLERQVCISSSQNRRDLSSSFLLSVDCLVMVLIACCGLFWRRQEEIVAGEEAITNLINHLDAKKYEALERTFKGVAKNFHDVFKELIPGGEGKMTMR